MQNFEFIHVTGSDATKFLQSQITADITKINQNDYSLSSYCNRQGRVISVFYVIKSDDDFYLYTLGNTADVLLAKIKKYSVFSKISFNKITIENEFEHLKNKFKLSNDINYYIENKIPILNTAHSEVFLPDNLNLLKLNAVSFNKGCFLGQEIIARVYYKGKTKKQLYKIMFDCLDVENDSFQINMKDDMVGDIIIISTNQALAVIDNNIIEQNIPLVLVEANNNTVTSAINSIE